jgi:hypothetical protein
MNHLKFEDRLKLFAVSNQLIENDLDRIEREYVIDLSRGHQRMLEKDQDYYPQLERKIRQEAADMSQHYEVFYSLEKSIRRLIAETLATVEPGTWWPSRIPTAITAVVDDRIKKETDSGVTRRSDEPIDYTTFGELSGIIGKNWDVFGAIFTSLKAVERVMANLNTLRGPIAHCSALAEDEIVRLRLSVRDWFRLME